MNWTEGFDSFIGALVREEKDMGKVIELKGRKVDTDTFERLARFAHEGLPYMTDDENWFDYDKNWAINVWWNWDEMTYRATAYRKIIKDEQEIALDLEYGLDLF